MLSTQGRLIVCFSVKSGNPYFWWKVIFMYRLQIRSKSCPVDTHHATISLDAGRSVFFLFHMGRCVVHQGTISSKTRPLFCSSNRGDIRSDVGQFSQNFNTWLFNISPCFVHFHLVLCY
jgi:hypothetical protein